MQFADSWSADWYHIWSPKYAIYNGISSVDDLCELSRAAAGLFTEVELLRSSYHKIVLNVDKCHPTQSGKKLYVPKLYALYEREAIIFYQSVGKNNEPKSQSIYISFFNTAQKRASWKIWQLCQQCASLGSKMPWNNHVLRHIISQK